ncbi:unnamed protein product [Eruca vesicaria subsp. sativa]|uniref:Glutaredoxin domain-containing protein n=1 Tax=Eruca vesicaria subsp. sativa TaxID=29727 RepID=A0ABC8JFM8_ERUVS|nr:unnamed protein product [Eruca vesicaria subsp. sativa]
MESIRDLVADKPVVVFSKSTCCMSHSIQTLISGFGAKMTVYEVDQLSNGKEIEKALVQMGCKPSVPAVFIGEQLIGGANQVMTLQVKNQLAALLKRAGAIWV